MREIKFRGKRCCDGEWVYGNYVESNKSWHGCHPHKSWIVPSPMTNGGWFAIKGAFPVVNETVGQYTGCKDKNGTEIFEGDIVRVDVSRFDRRIKNHQFTTTKVVWSQDRFSLYNVGIEVYYNDRIEILGNIHDNPELLKGGEE